MNRDPWTNDEVAMLRFLDICQPSLDPESYANVEAACSRLSEVRTHLNSKSLDKCLKHLDPNVT